MELIEDNGIFHNNSNVPQHPIPIQLTIFLVRLGHYSNTSSPVSPPLKQVYTRCVYWEVDAWSVLVLSDLSLVDLVWKTCLILKQSQRFLSWASAGSKC